MTQSRRPLLSRQSGFTARGPAADSCTGAVRGVQSRCEEARQQQATTNKSRGLRCTGSLFLLAAFFLLQWQDGMLWTEGSKRGAAGGGATGSRSRTASSDRLPRNHTYSFFHYLFGFPFPSSVLVTYALLVGAAAAAFFFLRRSSRSPVATREVPAEATLRKDDSKRVFRPCASICLNDILLKRKDGGKLCLEESAVQPFLSLCSWSKLFVFVQVKDNEEEHVMNELERIHAFDRGLLRHRVMFCSTPEGRASMVRQLQPLTHVDADSFIGVTLEGKVPNVVCLREPLKECVEILQAALRRY